MKLTKEPDNKYDKEAMIVKMEGLGENGYVANSSYTVNLLDDHMREIANEFCFDVEDILGHVLEYLIDWKDIGSTGLPTIEE